METSTSSQPTQAEPANANLDPTDLETSIPWDSRQGLLLLVGALPPLALVLMRIEAVSPDLLLGLASLLAIIAYLVLAYLIRRMFLHLVKSENRVKRLDDDLKRRRIEMHNFILDTIVELRRPLNGIVGMAQLSRSRHVCKDPTAQEFCEIVDYCSRHMLDQLEHVQFYSEIESGQAVFAEQLTNIHDLLSNALKVAEKHYQRPDVETDVQMDSSVPHSLTLPGDAVSIVVIDLIKNALRYTEKGHVRIRTRYTVAHEADGTPACLEISVKDTGTGISEKRKAEIQSTIEKKTLQRGFGDRSSGLGIATVAAVVRFLGGQIRIESDLGFGSTFTVDFPLKTEPASKVLERPRSFSPVEANTPAKFVLQTDSTDISRDILDPDLKPDPDTASNPRILVVDDEIFARRIIGELLRSLGHECDFAMNGLEAVRMAEYRQYHLIFMDLQMPVMDGVEATQKILGHPERFPGGPPAIVATSSHTRMADRKTSEDVGMSAFIAKPIELEKLKKVVEQFLPTAPAHQPIGAPAKSPENHPSADFDIKAIYDYSGQNLSLCQDFLQISVESLDRLLEDLRTSLLASDFEGIRFASHKMRGTLDFLACPTGSAICAELEALAKTEAPIPKAVTRDAIDQLSRLTQKAANLKITAETLRQAA